MCLGIPGKVVEIVAEAPLCMAKVSFSGVEQLVNLSFVPEAKPGDYVIVHVGHAIALLDEKAAEKTLSLLQELDGITPS